MSGMNRYHFLLAGSIVGAGLLYLGSAMTRGVLHWALYLAIVFCICGIWRAIVKLGVLHP